MKLRLPDVSVARPPSRYADRPDRLAGLVVGYLDGWGGEGGGDAMYPTMAALHELLVDRLGVAPEPRWMRKPDLSQPVPLDLLVPFTRETDLVINGEGL